MDRIISLDGTPISVQRHGAGPPLILVHGAAADHSRWAPLLPELGRHFTVLAMDRRGRGDSGDREPYAIEREYEDLAAVILAAGPDTSLVAHSFGAILALEAARHAPNLRRMVLYEPTFALGGRPVWPPETVARLDALLGTEGREAMLTAFYREIVGASDADIEALRRQPSWAGRLAAAHTIVREMQAISDLPEARALARIDVPTLLLVGEVSPPTFRRTRRAARPDDPPRPSDRPCGPGPCRHEHRARPVPARGPGLPHGLSPPRRTGATPSRPRAHGRAAVCSAETGRMPCPRVTGSSLPT